MVKNVSVVTTDDLDGSQGAETVAFGLDGVSYEIDLAPANRARLSGVLAPFIAAGRRVSRSSHRYGAGTAARSQPDRAAVRAWAREAGLAVSERGRMSTEVISQYEAAH
ncbi:MAG TPA: Lsr2 family protein [Nakamurella sp.]